MIRLRLFSADDPSRQIDARMIGADPVTIGRDASADWVIADPNRALSRKHCSVRGADGGVIVRDMSANGTYIEEARIAANTDVLVPPGSEVRIGNNRLQVEALAADPPAPVVLQQTPAPTPSLFAPPRGLDPLDPPARPARVDPFASQLAPDPLLGDHRAPGGRGGLVDHDAWDNRPAARAGDWDVPAGRGHEDLIGTPRAWTEPPQAERDGGYGFDAPFGRPMLAPVASSPADVAIPADWAVVPASAAESVPPIVLPPAPSAVSVPAPPIAQSAVLADPLVPAPAMPAPTPPTPLPVGAPPVPAHADAVLFEAFCAGARLSPASFAGEDRAAAMTRLGEIYRAMVLGLADLMSERTALKNEYRMARTQVRAEDNNPFKWAPPQRLAVEVLRGGDGGFVNGAQAVNEGFRDLKIHILCMLAGMRAAIAATMETLSPTQAEAGFAGKSFLIRAQRDAALWQEYSARFERFQLDADDSADGPINRAFRAAYEKQMGDLLGAHIGYHGGPTADARR